MLARCYRVRVAKRSCDRAARDDSFTGGALWRCLLAGLNHSRCKRFYDNGAAAVVTPGFAPKRDWCADRRASRDYRRLSGLEIGEQEVRAHPRLKPCFRFRRGMRRSPSRLLVSERPPAPLVDSVKPE